jgi:hypothetical protein
VYFVNILLCCCFGQLQPLEYCSSTTIWVIQIFKKKQKFNFGFQVCISVVVVVVVVVAGFFLFVFLNTDLLIYCFHMFASLLH